MDTFLQQIANALTLGSAYILVALGLYLVFNALHIPNFAHGELFVLGAYLQYALVAGLGINFGIAVIVSVLAVALLGVLIERTVFAPLGGAKVTAVLLASLGISILLQQSFALIWGRNPVSVAEPISGISEIGSVVVPTYQLFVIGIVGLSSIALGVLIYRTSFGRSVRAITQNPQLASLAGINAKFVGLATLAIGSGLAGLAGALLSPTVSIYPELGFHFTLVAFVILVVVGQGARMSVVVLGGIVLAILETLTAGYISSTLKAGVVFVILVIFLAVRPEGAVKTSATLKERL